MCQSVYRDLVTEGARPGRVPGKLLRVGPGGACRLWLRSARCPAGALLRGQSPSGRWGLAGSPGVTRWLRAQLAAGPRRTAASPLRTPLLSPRKWGAFAALPSHGGREALRDKTHRCSWRASGGALLRGGRAGRRNETPVEAKRVQPPPRFLRRPEEAVWTVPHTVWLTPGPLTTPTAAERGQRQAP